MKKNVPIAVWQKIQVLVESYRQYIIPLQTPDRAFDFIDAEGPTDFYFRCGLPNASKNYIIDFKPVGSDNVASYKVEVDADELVSRLENWLKVLKMYSELVSIYDDPILKSYETEFAGYFVMEGEQVNQRPFDLPKQILIEQYIRSVIGLLGQQKQQAGPVKQAQLDALIEESETLSSELTQLTQNQTLQRLAKIWARARKFGLGLYNTLWSEFVKASMKQVAEGTLKGDYLPDWDTISGMIP